MSDPQAPIVNMFGGATLNRLSWLRSSTKFMNAITASPQSKWLLFKAGAPLISISSSPNSTSTPSPKLAYLSTAEVKPFLGSEPFFGQGQASGSLLEEPDEKDKSAFKSESTRHAGPRVVFLGVTQHPGDSALPSSDFADADAAVRNIQGTPYFSFDVAELPEDKSVDFAHTEIVKSGGKLEFTDARMLWLGLDPADGSIFAVARSMVDWNYRNKFCPGCGSPTMSQWGGWKIACTSLLPWAEKKDCPSGKGLNNYTHPRTDAVVIMIAIDQSGDKILLGHNARFPGKSYSALAGFIEPGETFEEAVAREMWEEAGVTVWDVKYHSGQPWPYPANIMVGFFARADSSKPVRLDLDNELADASWFTRDQVLAVLNHPDGTNFGGRGKDKGGAGLEEPAFRVPPTSAIAGVLIRDWAHGKIGFGPAPKSGL